MAVASELTEPAVLATTKQKLFASDSENRYVVTDTQFVQEQWVDGQDIDEETEAGVDDWGNPSTRASRPTVAAFDS